MRSLTESEKRAIRAVAERLPDPIRLRLLDDLAHAMAEAAIADGSRITFDIAGYQRPPYRGQHSFGVQGELQDADQAKLLFDLFADENGHLWELEIVRWDGGALLNPDWKTLKFY